MKRIILSWILSTVLSIACAVPSYAATFDVSGLQNAGPGIVAPRWDNTYNLICNTSASGRTLYSTLVVNSSNTNTSISGTMYLERYANGSWSSVKSWKVSGKGQVSTSQTYTGTSGYRYRTRVSIQIGSDSINRTSNEVTL